MGLSTLTGDRHFLAEETKVAMASVDSSEKNNSINKNTVPEKLPAQVGASVPPPSLPGISPAPKAVTAPPAPAPKEPPQLPQNIYSGGLSSLPPPTRSLPNMETTKMSKLRDLLDKTAMTEADLYGSYSEPASQEALPEYAYEAPAMQARAGMENYNPEPNYSDYMAYVPEYSRDPRELRVEDIYDDYSPEQSLGYDPYQAYSNYEQMYATPGEVQGEVQDIQVPEVSPEVQEYEAQLKVYEESYTQIVNYLMQMGYSAEEAQAAAPSLLGQVSVEAPTAPEGYGRAKSASYVFKTAEEKLTSRYISQGYSPQQAQQLSLEYVIPESVKYASQARLIGAGLGAFGGGVGGHYAYDEDGESAGALAGGLLGALAGYGAPSISRTRYSGSALLDAVRSGNRKSKELQKLQQGIISNTKSTAAEIADARNLTGQAFEHAAALEAAANRSGDAQKLLAAAMPGYIAHRYLANTGGDNLVDRGFDYLGSAGDLVSNAASQVSDFASENKTPLLLGAGALGSVAGGAKLLKSLRDRKEKGSKSKAKSKSRARSKK